MKMIVRNAFIYRPTEINLMVLLNNTTIDLIDNRVRDFIKQYENRRRALEQNETCCLYLISPEINGNNYIKIREAYEKEGYHAANPIHLIYFINRALYQNVYKTLGSFLVIAQKIAWEPKSKKFFSKNEMAKLKMGDTLLHQLHIPSILFLEPNVIGAAQIIKSMNMILACENSNYANNCFLVWKKD